MPPSNGKGKVNNRLIKTLLDIVPFGTYPHHSVPRAKPGRLWRRAKPDPPRPHRPEDRHGLELRGAVCHDVLRQLDLPRASRRERSPLGSFRGGLVAGNRDEALREHRDGPTASASVHLTISKFPPKSVKLLRSDHLHCSLPGACGSFNDHQTAICKGAARRCLCSKRRMRSRLVKSGEKNH